MKKTELRQAFAWTCDNCGIDNFCNAVTAELSPSEKDHLICLEMGIEQFELEILKNEEWGFDGEFLVGPKEVICSSCQSKYEAEYPENYNPEGQF